MPLPNNFVQIDGQNCRCFICQSDIEDQSFMYGLPCGHGADLEAEGNSMHTKCLVDVIDHGLQTTAAQATCPICRANIEPATVSEFCQGIGTLIDEGATYEQLADASDMAGIEEIEDEVETVEREEQQIEQLQAVRAAHQRVAGLGRHA